MNDFEKIKLESGFKIPDNYFENFNKKMLSKINSKQEVIDKKSNRNIFIYSMSIAATIFLIFTISNKVLISENTESQYIENIIINDNFIISEFLDNDIQNNEISENIPDDEIQNYLIYDSNFDLENQ